MRAFNVFLASSILGSLAAGATPAAAEGFSAMVSDIETGIVLTEERIDTHHATALVGRLLTLSIAIDEIEAERLPKTEMIQINPGTSIETMRALQEVALGEEGWRGALTAVAGRVGHTPRKFRQEFSALGARIGMTDTETDVLRGRDGGPIFAGHTTVRDELRLATALFRAHGTLTKQVFGPATGDLETTHIWLAEDGNCLLVADGPKTGRSLAVAVTGTPDRYACFETAALLIAEDDGRLAAAIDSGAGTP